MRLFYDGQWLVEQLVALIDPDTALHSNESQPWKQPITPELRKEIRQCALKALVGEGSSSSSSSSVARAGIVPRAHAAVIQGFAKHIYKGNTELKLQVLRLLPDITTPTSENHHSAVLPVLHCLTSESDAVRQTAALVLQSLVDINDGATIGQLVTLLGAGRDHMFGDGTKRSAVALLVQLQKQSPGGLREEPLRAHSKYLHDVAFGLNSGSHQYHKYDEESIMEPMMEIEAKTLDHYSDEHFVAKGLACLLNTGSSGFDASHWKRRLLLLNREGALLMTSARSKQEPSTIFGESSIFYTSRVSYGSVVPHAIRIEVLSDSGSKDVSVLGLFTRDEAAIWFRDFQNIVQRNSRRAAMEVKEGAASGHADGKADESGGDFLGKTERNLDLFVEQLLNPVTVADAGLKEKQSFIQAQLSRLVGDSKAFIEAAEAATHVAIRQKSSIDKGAAEDMHLHVKMDMAALLQLLRANRLYGKTGFTEQAVRHAWKIANASDGSAANTSADKDKLKLDWQEYQTLIRLLASKAGVVLQGIFECAVCDSSPTCADLCWLQAITKMPTAPKSAQVAFWFLHESACRATACCLRGTRPSSKATCRASSPDPKEWVLTREGMRRDAAAAGGHGRRPLQALERRTLVPALRSRHHPRPRPNKRARAWRRTSQEHGL